MEENFSPEESLEVIQSMINKAKNQFSENGDLYLLWGWWVFICAIAEYILLNYVRFEMHWIVWWTFIFILIYQFFYLRKKMRMARARTYTDHIIGYVWITFVVLMALLVFLIQRIDPNKADLIDPAFLMLYGMPTFLSGVILKFKPLVIGAIGCWVLAVISTFISVQYHLLLIPVAMLMAWIIPGYILRSMTKKISETH